MKKNFCIIFIFLFTIHTSFSNVKLPRIVGNNMVLQRDRELNIWGWADKAEKVTVIIANKTVSTKTGQNGKWTLKLQALPSGGPYDMVIKGKNTITLKNILIGDVWICSGQSNMQYPIGAFSYAQKEIDDANYPNIRLFQVPNNVSAKPKEDVMGGEWNPAIKENIREFSAVAYFFGRDLFNKLNIPIGLINMSWGGTIAETWVSADGLKEFPEFKSRVDELQGESNPFLKTEKSEDERKSNLLKEFNQKDPGITDGKPFWNGLFFTSDWATTTLPQPWEKKDLPNYDGTVWYKKEFSLPENMAGKDLILSLGPIDDMDVTWLNGVQVGGLNAYNLPREYKVAGNIMKPGKNTIVVRVIDLGGGGGFFGASKLMNIQLINDPNTTFSLAGPWQYKAGYEAKSIAPSTASAGPNSYPTLLYNAMIAPLVPFGIKGAIWYQGESNADRAYQYRTLFPALITDWRKKWNQGDFPFLFVQLANFMKPDEEPKMDPWPELREAQTMALSAVPNTGMAVAIDLGEAGDIHPSNKQDVGKRLALAARKLAYGEDIVYSGPIYESMAIEGNKIRLKFKNTGSGLMSKDKYGYPKGFAIAGDDKKFVWAKAIIENNSILVYSDEVKSPVAVRYAWANNPEDASLYNKEMLPASPFRTDSWPGVTEGKK